MNPARELRAIAARGAILVLASWALGAPAAAQDLSIEDVVVTEGDSGTTKQASLTVRLSPPNAAADVAVDFATADGTATAAGGDYVPATGRLTIPAGQDAGVVRVLVRGDFANEPGESFFVDLSNPVNAAVADGRGICSIRNDEVQVMAATVSRIEGDSGSAPLSFVATLSGACPFDVRVDFETRDGAGAGAPGAATAAGGDYVPRSGTIVFPAGTTVQTIEVEVNGDTIEDAPAEHLSLVLRSVDAVAFTATGIIRDDDGSGQTVLVLDGPAPSTGDALGSAVGSGPGLLAGAPLADPGGVGDAGAVFRFDGTTGAVVLALANPSPAPGDEFGAAVATLGGSRIVVGAPGRAVGGVPGAGSVYVFEAGSGNLALTIPNPFPGAADGFGSAVAALGTDIIVAAPADDPGGVADAGSVYVFDGTTGAPRLAIPNPAPVAGDEFGRAVAALNGAIVAGAPGADVSGATDAGTVYVLDGATGATVRVLPPPRPASGGGFGFALAAVSGNIVVGAPFDSPRAAGAVYVLDGASGALLRDVPNPVSLPFDGFGFAVAAAGGASNFAVGVPFRDGAFEDQGAVYLIDGKEGAWRLNVANPSPERHAEFGSSLAGVGRNFLVGAPGADRRGFADAGAAFLINGNLRPVARSSGVRFLTASIAFTLDGSDANGDPLTFAIVRPPAHGTLSGTPPHLVYTLDPGYVGPDEFKYSVSDGTLAAMATFTLGPPAPPPPPPQPFFDFSEALPDLGGGSGCSVAAAGSAAAGPGALLPYAAALGGLLLVRLRMRRRGPPLEGPLR